MDTEPNFEGEEMKLPTQNNNNNIEVISENPVEKTKGIFIVILVAALAMILVALFFWYNSTITPVMTEMTPERPTAEMNKEPETTNASAEVESFGAMSTSNEIPAIEADLESTNLDSLEKELQQIDIELDASIGQL